MKKFCWPSRISNSYYCLVLLNTHKTIYGVFLFKPNVTVRNYNQLHPLENTTKIRLVDHGVRCMIQLLRERYITAEGRIKILSFKRIKLSLIFYDGRFFFFFNPFLAPLTLQKKSFDLKSQSQYHTEVGKFRIKFIRNHTRISCMAGTQKHLSGYQRQSI